MAYYLVEKTTGQGGAAVVRAGGRKIALRHVAKVLGIKLNGSDSQVTKLEDLPGVETKTLMTALPDDEAAAIRAA
jgi:hypothetical protein